MRTKDEHFKVTPYDDLEVGAIFVAVIELEEFAARCLKAFCLFRPAQIVEHQGR